MSGRDAAPRLGRGLAALIADMSANDRRGEPVTRMLALESLAASPFQPRVAIDGAALDELAASIRARGLLQPLLVRPHPQQEGRFEIIAGERRWRAAQAAGLREVPALVQDLGDQDAMAAALVENLQRQDLNAIEEAEGYRRLFEDFGVTQERLAEAVGKSRSHVANTMRLLRLPASVQQEVRRGTISAGHARALLAHSHPAHAAMTVVARGLNVRQTEQLAAQSTVPRRNRSPEGRRTPMDSDSQAVEQTLTAHLGIKVTLQKRDRGGLLQIHYDSLDQLDGLVRLLTQ